MAVISELVVVRSEPLCAESPISLEDEVRTPVERFYVRNNFAVPAAVPALTIGGAVRRPFRLTPEELGRLPRRRLSTTLECAGNGRSFMSPAVAGEEWRLGAVSTGAWEGIALADLLDRAGVEAGAVEVLFHGADGFARSLPLERALHPDTLLADRLNGEALRPEHGAPLRLLVPGWYGMASVKWLSAVEVLTEPFEGHFQRERYVIAGQPVREMRVRALILDPPAGAGVRRARQTVRGLAWTGTGRVTALELSDDGGATWIAARLCGLPRDYTWRRWECEWEPSRSGPATLLARAADSSGERQPLEPVWNALGYCYNTAVPHPLTVI